MSNNNFKEPKILLEHKKRQNVKIKQEELKEIDFSLLEKLQNEISKEDNKVAAPFDPNKIIGNVSFLTDEDIKEISFKESDDWRHSSLDERTKIFKRISDRFEDEKYKFFYLLANEAGKTLKDCDAEVRESIDFINYYSAQAKKNL